ncbi:unnamed protein product [Brassicogethes aeneus]|uniref:Sorbin and SH3 domain-containing protein 1 n=1 Tax=Brassicogethes aeneus TaxID=1431903 RepID=A0A9P0FHP6_BRAAE|nr:unnamed protein product [Brassicogethes aeneus]
MTTREVVLEGGSPWGFRMHGGIDTSTQLKISRVNPGSKAALRGIREGDFITSINGKSTKNISNVEAHNLLKNAGENLVLGLNEDCEGSPKRRQYRTVHQETHEETVKKSSVTTFSIKTSQHVESKEPSDNEENLIKGIEKNNQINGKQPDKPKLSSNGISTESTISTLTEQATVRSNSTDFAIASQRSSYSNLTPSPSSASTLTEDGDSTIEQMADSGSSKSRRRRNRRKNNKNKCNADDVIETNTITQIKEEELCKTDYRVDSPDPKVIKTKDIVRKTSITKSRSLDNDEMLNIQELSDSSETEHRIDNNAIISEASESEVEWEETDNLRIPNKDTDNCILSNISLPLEDYRLEEVNLISPEEELTLRNFLECLNLVNSPDDDLLKHTPEISTADSIKEKKAKKRMLLEQYFLPRMNNPRFLDVISEETSDTSDKEVTLLKRNLKRGTPELDKPKSPRKHRRPLRQNAGKPVLVGTKILETTGVQSVVLPETSSNVEVVFLSSSESPDTLSDYDNLDEEDELASSCETLTEQKTELKKNTDSIIQFTPPPTPEHSPKNSIIPEILSVTSYDKSVLSDAVESAIKYSNVISPLAPSRSPSVSSESENASTAKYNPLSSSVADMSSIGKEDDEATVGNDACSLREICLKCLIKMPFGEEMLQELAEVSQSIESYTSKLPSEVLPRVAPNLPAFVYNKQIQESLDDKKDDTQHNASDKIEEEDGKIPTTSAHRLLSIIREEPSVHFEEFNPRFTEKLSNARSQARDLTEWLALARSKSISHIVDENTPVHSPLKRRTSLPQEIYERQLNYLLEKERNIQRELEEVAEERMKLRQFQADDFHISSRGDYAESRRERPASMPVIPTEFFRQQMYEEYMEKMAAREERKQLKVIKLSTSKVNIPEDTEDKLGDVQHICAIEEEFMEKLKQKNGGTLKENSVEPPATNNILEDEEPVLIMDGPSLSGSKKLPKHLKEFIDITKHQQTETICENTSEGIWSPGQRQDSHYKEERFKRYDDENGTIPPVWTPKSATTSPIVERKEFKPVNFQSPVLGRKRIQSTESIGTPDSVKSEARWKLPDTSATEASLYLSSSLEKRLPNSSSLPASGFCDLGTQRLPRAQNPTITLLQKAREGQLPRGAHYIEPEPPIYQKRSHYDRLQGISPVYSVKSEYLSDSENERSRRGTPSSHRQHQGSGHTTKDGMPIILRSEIRDEDQSKWYKKMYDTIHKQKPRNSEYVTVKYKQKRAQYPYASGYLSEPEPGAYDSDYADYKYATLDRRRTPYKERDHDYTSASYTMPRNLPNKSSSSSDILRNGQDLLKPGRIENYTPGHSSIAEKEAKEWWDEVMDIFDGHLDQQKKYPPQQPKSFINQALKESGYESDSTLVFRRKEEATSQPLSPKDQKEAYKTIQKGGDVPFHGLRKNIPDRPKEPEAPPPPEKGRYFERSQSFDESPRKYVENEVTIHYRTPVRQEIKEFLSEDELAHKQAEAMKKIYQEERRRKYLQELQDMNRRRHTDNFIPSQKSPISLNRYDDFEEAAPSRPRPRSPEPRLLARALYNFVGQTARELTFRKGDLIHVRRQVDKNWYEGELNAMVGLLPVNHVEIVPHDGIKATARKSYEGQGRAKYNFVAQTQLELSLAKGELVTITRKVDQNWYEGKIGGRKGIFPVAYIEVLIDPQDPPTPSSKPVASPAAHSMLLNGSAGGKESMGTHSYTPILSSTPTSSGNTYQAKPIHITGNGTYGSLNRYMKSPVNQALHIETQSETIPYRALYKYNPQNDDELELLEGDTVYVLEKCDDGWFVGSSDRTGAFGTFPGNYVEKI